MKKIAILGCENSHANSFIKFIQQKPEFSDIEIFGVYSNDPSASAKLHDEFGVNVLENYTDAVGAVDGVIITARHGDLHYEYAKPYLDSGIPMFIDKPFTIKESDALELGKALKSKGTKLSGGSSARQDKLVRQLKEEALGRVMGDTVGGIARAPYQPNSEYGGFYFYSQHLVEMICEVFGRYPISVESRLNGRQLTVLFHYESYDAVGIFTENSSKYYLARFAENGDNGGTVNVSSAWFEEEFREFYGLLCGGENSMSYEDFIAPVFILNAIERSIKSGKSEPVAKFEI